MPQLIVPLEHGAIIQLTASNPAAGENFLITLAGNFRWCPISVNFRLATDANVANRYADLEFTLVPAGTMRYHSTIQQTASQTFDISWVAGWPIHGQGSVNRWTIGMPEFMIMNGGGSMASAVRQIQATDQLSSITAYFRRWPMQTI